MTIKSILGKMFVNDKQIVVLDDTAENGGIEDGTFSGTNYNGRWVKFPNGTMMVDGYAHLNGVTVMTIPYPIAFVGGANISASVYDYGDPVDSIGNIDYGTDGNLNFKLRANTAGREFSFMAIGRWK